MEMKFSELFSQLQDGEEIALLQSKMKGNNREASWNTTFAGYSKDERFNCHIKDHAAFVPSLWSQVGIITLSME